MKPLLRADFRATVDQYSTVESLKIARARQEPVACEYDVGAPIGTTYRAWKRSQFAKNEIDPHSCEMTVHICQTEPLISHAAR